MRETYAALGAAGQPPPPWTLRSVARDHRTVIVSPTDSIPSSCSPGAASAESSTGEESSPKSPTKVDPNESHVEGSAMRFASRIGWIQVRLNVRSLLEMVLAVESMMVMTKLELVNHVPL